MRHFNVLALTECTSSGLNKIFSTIVSWHFQSRYNFAESVQLASNAIVEITLQVYSKARKTLLPTPAKSHYTFNLRDVSRVIQGCLMIVPSASLGSNDVVRLWAHETFRVFHDRLVDDDDRAWFLEVVRTYIGTYFDVTFKDAFQSYLSADLQNNSSTLSSSSSSGSEFQKKDDEGLDVGARVGRTSESDVMDLMFGKILSSSYSEIKRAYGQCDCASQAEVI